MNDTAYSMLRKYLNPFLGQVLFLLLLILLGIGLQLGAPQLLRLFLDGAMGGKEVGWLRQTAVFYLLLVFGNKLVHIFAVYWSENLGWRTTNQLRADLAEHCLRLDMPFHKRHNPGELISRIDGDVTILAEYFSQIVVHLLGNGLLLAALLVVLFQESVLFGSIGAVYAIVNILFMRMVQKPVVAIWGEVREHHGKQLGYIEERLLGREDIRANGAEPYMLAGLYPLMHLFTNAKLKRDLWGGFTFGSSYIFYVLAFTLTLWLSAQSYLRGEISLGTVYLVCFYIRLLETPIKYIRRQLESLQRALAGIGRIATFFAHQSTIVALGTGDLPQEAVSVNFADVTFRYRDHIDEAENDGVDVLKQINFQLPAKQRLGILGRTGSGKTTLTRLLFRLYDLDEGAILFGDEDIRDLSLEQLRRYVGVVTQDVQIFAATVRDNLTLFRQYDPDQPAISDDQIWNALEDLGMKEWVEQLPHGLDSYLKAGGQGLSAGEAQLLAFARVFLDDPKLIILDEASSRLDPQTEQLLERAIDKLLEDRTAIIVAHQLETVMRADQILILSDGVVQEFGARETLMQNKSSQFAHLLEVGLAGYLT